jgi:hypothetical protein
VSSNQGNSMKIYVPYFKQLEETYDKRKEVIFCNALGSLPEVGGGRGATDIAHSTLQTVDDLKRLSERYGDRFQLLANGTFPVYTPRVKAVCEILARNHSSITVSRLRFAQELKADMPTLALSASCVMSLYRPFPEIMKSDLFEGVCAPQFWNYNIPEMCQNVPQEMRHRVYYIVNSPCVWSMGCRNHYEVMTTTYTYQFMPIRIEPTWQATCRRKVNVPPIDWGRGVFEKLLESGFTAFKFQGRDKPFEIIQSRLKEAIECIDKSATEPKPMGSRSTPPG